jgi:membrane-associated protease RseP (regulator of RpoE activity)
MNRLSTVLTCFLALAAAALPARAADPTPDADKGAYLGVLFGPVPDALYDQVPQLARDQGVLVTQVLANSPAEKASLRRNDVLLKYDGAPIRDCDDLVRLLQKDKPGRTVKLTYLHGGRETTVETTLTLGLAIRSAPRDDGKDSVAPGVAKPIGPPSATISVEATPLERGRIKVTIEYYPEGPTGKLKSLSCEGDLDEIEKKVKAQLGKENLNEREITLAGVALQRILLLNAAKPPPEKDKP